MIESGYYPAGAEFDSAAPWNQSSPPEESFDVCVSQSLSKSVSVETDNYFLEDGVPDTSDTNWEEVYEEDHYTPLQLINIFKRYLESEVNHTETVSKEPSFLKHLISECSDWNDDETEIFEE